MRINDRYVQEVIEADDICPFARGGRVSGKAIREVLFQTTLDVDPVVTLILSLESDARPLEVIQVLFPRLSVTPRALEHFSADVRRAREQRPGPPKFAHAAFHPDFPYDDRSADALVAFFRRSPDAMIQLVALETLDALKRHGDRGTRVVDLSTLDLHNLPEPEVSISERIAKDNLARVRREGREQLERRYQDIRRDREEHYRAIGLVPSV